MSLYYYEDLVVQLEYDDELKTIFGEDWSSYLCEGKFEELKQQCSDRISKGHGKGKGKQKYQ